MSFERILRPTVTDQGSQKDGARVLENSEETRQLQLSIDVLKTAPQGPAAAL